MRSIPRVQRFCEYIEKIREILRVNLFVNSINFKAGQAHLFSDFDGTYFSVKQSDVKKDINNQNLLDLKDIYGGINTEHINNLLNEFKENVLLKEIEELPVYIIIVKNSKKNLPKDLKLLLKTFHTTEKSLKLKGGNWIMESKFQ